MQDRIDAIRARCDAATPGPWAVKRDIVTLLERGGCGACQMCANYIDEKCKLEGPVCEPEWRGASEQEGKG